MVSFRLFFVCQFTVEDLVCLQEADVEIGGTNLVVEEQVRSTAVR